MYNSMRRFRMNYISYIRKYNSKTKWTHQYIVSNIMCCYVRNRKKKKTQVLKKIKIPTFSYAMSHIFSVYRLITACEGLCTCIYSLLVNLLSLHVLQHYYSNSYLCSLYYKLIIYYNETECTRDNFLTVRSII